MTPERINELRSILDGGGREAMEWIGGDDVLDLLDDYAALRESHERLREAASNILHEVVCLLQQRGQPVETTKQRYDALRAALAAPEGKDAET